MSPKTLHLLFSIACVAIFATQASAEDQGFQAPSPNQPLTPFLPIPRLPRPLPWYPFPIFPTPNAPPSSNGDPKMIKRLTISVIGLSSGLVSSFSKTVCYLCDSKNHYKITPNDFPNISQTTLNSTIKNEENVTKDPTHASSRYSLRSNFCHALVSTGSGSPTIHSDPWTSSAFTFVVSTPPIS
ncbi:hypothetical protein ACFE04_008926 [Oxalis oulophora]